MKNHMHPPILTIVKSHKKSQASSLDIARACKKSQAPSNYGHGPNPTKTYKVAFLLAITKAHKKSQAHV
jgi:hypothetical protein